MNITPTRLFRLLGEVSLVCPVKVIPAGTILWQHGSRKSSLGGYVGTFSETYSYPYQGHTRWSPLPARVFPLKTDKVEPYYP